LLVVCACWTGPVAPPPEQPRPVKPSEPPRSEFDGILVHFEAIVDSMCACHDRDCADRITDDLSGWAKEIADHHDIKPTEAEMSRMNALSERYAQCVNVAMGGPPTP
jgi:hypothetical protein